MSKEQQDPKNVLVIHFGQLGDVVLGLPALGAIRQRYPAARLTVMAGMPSSEVVRLARVADDIIAVDRVELRDGNTARSVAKILKLVSLVRRGRYDLVIDLHSLSETNLLGLLAGIKHRLYANRENRSLDRLGNFRPRPPIEDKSKHLSSRYLDVLRPLGISVDEPSFTFEIPVQELELLRAKLGDRADAIPGAVGLFPGAGHASRCWDIGNFASLAQRLLDKGRRVVIFLGPEEATLKNVIGTSFPDEVAVIDGLTLSEFITALSRVSLLVCNDTGPAHLAACSGTGLVLLLDGRAPLTYLPLTQKIEVVRAETIDEISVDSVVEAVDRQLFEAGTCLP